jgi:hypothetical protein
MATPASRYSHLFKNPPPATEEGKEQAATTEPDDGRPDFSKPYRAFGHPRTHALRSLFLYFNAAERQLYGRKKIQIQYEHLDSDDPSSEGFAADGQSFSIVVSGARKMLRITVRGRELEEGYDYITFHRMPWMRSMERGRDFGQVEGPVITGFEIEPVEEAESAEQVSGKKVIEMAEERGIETP